MPELPEVESVRRGLASHLTGAVVTELRVLDRRILGTTSHRVISPEAVSTLQSALAGAVLSTPARRGKFLWVPLADPGPQAECLPGAGCLPAADAGPTAEPGDSAAAGAVGEGGRGARLHALSLHLGMSGQLRIHTPDEPMHRHTRAVLNLRVPAAALATSPAARAARSPGEPASAAGGSSAVSGVPPAAAGPGWVWLQLRFLDQRIFGHIGVDALVPDGADLIPTPIAHIARDPLDGHWDLETTARRMQRSRSAVKAVLMDQTVVSGVGNIYADEALHRAGVHPLAVPSRLRVSRLRRVLDEARTVMAEALDQGGTSFDALYVHVNGESGYFARSLRVYGREGEDCRQCGERVSRIIVSGRSTHFCPSCQRPQRR